MWALMRYEDTEEDFKAIELKRGHDLAKLYEERDYLNRIPVERKRSLVNRRHGVTPVLEGQ